MSIKRRLVLTFDAFGTLFRPKDSIGAQYALVAARHGLLGFTDDQLNFTFRRAFKKALIEYPNYGKASNMGAEKWWSQVITNSFQPLRSERIPKSLVDALLTRFSTAEGYSLYPDVLPFFRGLLCRKITMAKENNPTEIIVGIVSNSDDRVSSVLQSFGFSMSPKRYSKKRSISINPSRNDIDFAVFSYDVGFAKPDHRIFDAAKECGGLPQTEKIAQIYVHVGDHPVEDYQAAEQAGWKGVHISGHGRNEGHTQDVGETLSFGDLSGLADYLWDDILPSV